MNVTVYAIQVVLKKYSTSMYQKEVLQTQFLIASAPSRSYFIIVLHVLAVFALVLAQLNCIWRLILLGAVAGSGYWHWKTPWCPVLLFYNSDTGWSLKRDSGVRAIVIQSSTVLTALFCVIHYCEGSSSTVQTVLCARDSLPGNDYKRLMVLLKISHIAKEVLK